MQPKEQEARHKNDTAQEKLQRSKAALQAAEAQEKAVRKQVGRLDKPIRSYICDDIFPLFNVSFSKYHGGKMEGPAIRNLMKGGEELFSKIETYLKSLDKRTEQNGQALFPPNDKEIHNKCHEIGRLASMLDSLFAMCLTKRGEVTDDLVAKLERDLLVTMKEWKRVGLSFTPKFHVLIDHAPEQLRMTGGFADMLEDAIERSHQRRSKNESRFSRMRNQVMAKQSQAKYENAGMIRSIASEMNRVQTRRKRNLSQQSQENKVERDESRKKARITRRESSFASCRAQDQTQVVEKPLAKIKAGLKSQQEQREEEQE